MSTLIYLVVFTLAFLVETFSGALVSQEVAIRAAEVQGFSDIRVTDHSYAWVGVRGCDGADTARFTVRGKNAAGKEVEFYVCSGFFFKGGTIRTP
ncbi:MAG: hypothetical protein Q8Q41_01410 [bacterium]|nr:hypothetical protein [bacterium]